MEKIKGDIYTNAQHLIKATYNFVVAIKIVIAFLLTLRIQTIRHETSNDTGNY
jgi:hypothetical protein